MAHLGVGGATRYAQHSNYPTAYNHSFRSESAFDAAALHKRKCGYCGVWGIVGRDCTLCGTGIAGPRPIAAMGSAPTTPVRLPQHRSTTPTASSRGALAPRSPNVGYTSHGKVHLTAQQQQQHLATVAGHAASARSKSPRIASSSAQSTLSSSSRCTAASSTTPGRSTTPTSGMYRAREPAARVDCRYCGERVVVDTLCRVCRTKATAPRQRK